MSTEGDGTQFTLLGRIDEVDPSALTELYAYPEPDPDAPRSCWVRGNMIASVDGGATSDGKSGGLGG
ncbi:MAG TPA: pyrimidine reductase family protein, partial [Mycobacterium sp.]|nr:pyrimidine reductase family protein [Mycobacterium sp.]